MKTLLAGVEIGGTKIQVVLGTADGKILETLRYSVARENGADGIQKQILEGLRMFQKNHSFSAIGVGFGGPIDWKTGKVFKSHHINGWDGFPLGAWLNSEFKVPVIADNDANVAALAEAKAGVGRNKTPVFYMTVGSGIGGGVIQNGCIYHGQHPGEVEVGHTRIPFPHLPPEQWPILETLCSGWSLDRRIREAIQASPDSILAAVAGGASNGGEARFLSEAMKKGDSDALKIWNESTGFMALALSHVIHLFHPQILVIGGGVSHFGKPWLDAIRVNLERLVMTAYRGTYELTLSELGEQVVPVGALLLAAQQVVENK